MGDAPENYFGIADDRELEILGGELAARRLAELERAAPLTSFTRDDLVGVHSYLMQDIYPWAGELRTTEVGAMGMAMCRAQFVDRELDRVIRDMMSFRRTHPRGTAYLAGITDPDHRPRQ